MRRPRAFLSAADLAVCPAQDEPIGDLDRNGNPDVTDAIGILRIVVSLDPDNPLADCDGSVDTGGNDAILLLRCVVGLDEWPIVIGDVIETGDFFVRTETRSTTTRLPPTGATLPGRTLHTGAVADYGLAWDCVRDILYIARDDADAIDIIATASEVDGAMAPTTLTGAATGLDARIIGLLVDARTTCFSSGWGMGMYRYGRMRARSMAISRRTSAHR